MSQSLSIPLYHCIALDFREEEAVVVKVVEPKEENPDDPEVRGCGLVLISINFCFV